ncbi:hypothetical protein EVAR_57635_1 [Eumeta japonica]|uniref:Uncharacterized protein n=1 Tax=Eumeta variegata TaxID=151549 RepID=A0A4C1ZM99_EUMVA|nr:hypothetical protein EVAR_57635_1 [Eumeta japonica]
MGVPGVGGQEKTAAPPWKLDSDIENYKDNDIDNSNDNENDNDNYIQNDITNANTYALNDDGDEADADADADAVTDTDKLMTNKCYDNNNRYK